MPSSLFLTGTLEFGGSEKKVVKIANALAESGHNVGLAYLNKPDPLLASIDSKVPVTYLDRKGKYSIRSLQRLISLLRVQHPNVVTVNFYPLLYAVPAAKLFLKGNCEVVSLINTTEFVDREWVLGQIYAPFIRRCDKIVFGCEAQRTLWIGRYRIPANRSYCIYNGVDADYFAVAAVPDSTSLVRAKLGIPDGSIVFGSIGRLAPEKNFELLINAVGNLHDQGKNAYLILVGAGAEEAQLKHAVQQRGLGDRVRFIGVLADVRPAIKAMDIFVLPSRAVETFSNAALEAMAMERPVVLSNIGGAAEMIDDEETGYLFESGDIDKLTRILLRLYGSADLRCQLGTAARRKVLERFTFTVMSETYRRLIFG